MMKKMNVLGVDLDCLSYDEMFPIFDQWLKNKDNRSHSIALINAYGSVSAMLDKQLGRIYQGADLRGIDSMPLLYWARLFYYNKSDRFYAPDLLLQVCGKAQVKGYTFFLYGGYPGAVDGIEKYLKERYEGIRVIGKYTPPFRSLSEEEDQELCDMINALKPDFLWVGLGTPKQDYWIAEHREKIKGTIMVASGATFDFFSGRIRQAPTWIRSSGFEWLYRLTQDFRRLWVRYTVYNVIFVVAFILQRLRILRFENYYNMADVGSVYETHITEKAPGEADPPSD